MTSRIYIAKTGGGTIELSNYNPSLRKGAPFFDHNEPLVQLGNRCANGEASQGTFIVSDPDAEIPRADDNFNLPPHKLVTWTEDASGDELWLSRGRVSTTDGGRGRILADDEVEFEVTVDDANSELRGQAFTEEWVRPEETDYERLVALQAYTLDGASSTATNHRDSCDITVDDTHLAPDANTVTMPAKTYPVGAEPQTVVSDCADSASKVYGVVIHHTGGTSHLCLFYTLETDHTTYATAAKISDHQADWDPTHATTPVWEPIWDMGKATLYDGQQLLSGLVSTYGVDQSVFVDNPTNVTDYDYWVEQYFDSQSETAAQAEARAESLLAYRGRTHVTHRVSVKILPSQHHLLQAGMSIQARAAALFGGEFLDTWQTRRIAECQFEPAPDGTYWAHLHLDRAQKGRRYSSGAAQPAATTPQPAPECLTSGTQTVLSNTEGTGTEDPVVWPGTTTTSGACWNSAEHRTMGASSTATGEVPVSAGTLVTGAVNLPERTSDGAPWTLNPSYYYKVYLELLGSGLPTLSTTIVYANYVGAECSGPGWVEASAEVPTGYTEARLVFGAKLGGYRYQGRIESAAITSESDDPFCLEEPGDSPYFARSDDPRFEDLQQQIDTLEGVDIQALLRHYTHGVFVAAAHGRDDDPAAPYILYSLDGLAWSRLTGPLSTNNTSPTYAGDPTLIHWNGYFWLTHQYSTSASRAKFTLMRSENLVDWTEVTEVAPGVSGEDRIYPGAWALNEDGTVYVDPSDGRPRLIVTITVVDSEAGPFAPYELHPTNDAMTSWSTAAAVTGDFPANIIDPYVIRHNDRWAFWYKSNEAGDETVEYATSATLGSGYVVQESGDWAGWGTARESPSLVRLDDGTWRIYIQKYTTQTDGVFYSESTDDWATWSALTQLTTDFMDDDALAALDPIRLPGIYDHERDPLAHAVQIDAAIEGRRWEPVIFDNAGTPEIVYFQDSGGVWDIVMHEVS